MSFKTNSGILCLLICTAAFCPAPPAGMPLPERWVILKDCKVVVNGRTNINKFSCSIPEYLRTDTLSCNRGGGTSAIMLSGKLSLPVISFDCLNQLITNDLRKTLKAKEFPSLSICFLSLEKYPDIRSQEPIDGAVNIELAGVSRKIIVSYVFSMDQNQVISMTGKQDIRFSDFMLIPPRRLGGMIRTDDRLSISFILHFRKIDVN